MESVDRKYCSCCQRNKTIDKFDEGYKSCNTCLAKMKTTNGKSYVRYVIIILEHVAKQNMSEQINISKT